MRESSGVPWGIGSTGTAVCVRHSLFRSHRQVGGTMLQSACGLVVYQQAFYLCTYENKLLLLLFLSEL